MLSMTFFCLIHQRIYQPASSITAYDAQARRTVQVPSPAHWRPLGWAMLASARHLAQQAGCAGQIVVEVVACDVCEQDGSS